MSGSPSMQPPICSESLTPRRKVSLADILDSREIRRGLKRREFQAYLQPKVHLISNEVHSVEVLARWEHPRYGLLAPSAFIPRMAHENLLDDLLLEMLEQGLACQAQLYGQGKVLDFAFNLSLFQLTNEELLNRLITRLQRHTMSSVTFEITEDGPAVTTDNSVRAMTRLRELGVCLSMDDYGIGQSTLLRLCRLPFDEIKLAGEFTRQLYDDRHHLGIARSTVLLAHELDLQLVVEGIETEEQRRCLVQLGVQIGQGYLFAQPMRTDSLSRWLETHKLNSAV